MKIGGYGVRQHLRLLAPLFALIVGVWALRLALELAALPLSLVRWFSVTVATAIAFLGAALLIHFKRFGGYANAVLAAFLLVFWAQLLIVAAIAFGALTHTENVYTLPEFSGNMNPWQHILGHITFGVGFETLFGAGMSCLFLWVLRRLAPLPGATRSS